MIRALLVDLDDTLLENDVARFVPAYLKLLTGDLQEFGAPETVAAALQAGTQAMLASDDPEWTLLDVFLDSFSSRVGSSPSAVFQRIRHFYDETYPQLAAMTRPKAGASTLLSAAAQRGLSIAVATNPLLTQSAVEQRLAWADVPVAEIRYALIASVETFHFAKPRLQYYAEVLARLGLLPSEAVMIGNDALEDLAPAWALGIAGFQIGSAADGTWPAGSLEDGRLWLDTDTTEKPTTEASPQALTARLEGQMATLLGRIANRSREEMRRQASTDSLSLLETLCHLRDVDREVNLPRLDTILKTDDPFLSAVNTDDWIRARSYNEEDPATARAAYIQGRREVLDRLRTLTDDQWKRSARHSLLGPLTLADWVAVMTEHDLRHLPPADGREYGPDGERTSDDAP